MPTNFPSGLDTLINPTWTSTLDSPSHSVQHSNANDAIEALQVKVGINGSADTSSLDFKTSRQTTKGDLSVHNGTNLVRLPVGSSGQMLVADPAEPSWLKYIAPSSGGTVTDVSFVNANGFTGSIANATTSPDITIWTSVTGLLKGDGTSVSAAVAWTDYLSPSGFVQGNIVSLTAQGTITTGMAIYIDAGNAYPTNTTTYARVDGVAIEGATTGNPVQVDIGKEWKNVPSVTAWNYYTFGNSGVFSAVVTPSSDQNFYCPKAGTLVPSFQRRWFSALSCSSSWIWDSDTTSSVYIDIPTVIFWTISNSYSAVWAAGAFFEWSFDNSTWSTVVWFQDSNVNRSETIVWAILVEKMWIRWRTYSGNSTTWSILLR